MDKAEQEPEKAERPLPEVLLPPVATPTALPVRIKQARQVQAIPLVVAVVVVAIMAAAVVLVIRQIVIMVVVAAVLRIWER